MVSQLLNAWELLHSLHSACDVAAAFGENTRRCIIKYLNSVGFFLVRFRGLAHGYARHDRVSQTSCCCEICMLRCASRPEPEKGGVVQVIIGAVQLECVEYLANGAMCRVIAELKGWGRHVRTKQKDRTEMIPRFGVMSTMFRTLSGSHFQCSMAEKERLHDDSTGDVGVPYSRSRRTYSAHTPKWCSQRHSSSLQKAWRCRRRR